MAPSTEAALGADAADLVNLLRLGLGKCPANREAERHDY